MVSTSGSSGIPWSMQRARYHAGMEIVHATAEHLPAIERIYSDVVATRPRPSTSRRPIVEAWSATLAACDDLAGLACAGRADDRAGDDGAGSARSGHALGLARPTTIACEPQHLDGAGPRPAVGIAGARPDSTATARAAVARRRVAIAALVGARIGESSPCTQVAARCAWSDPPREWRLEVAEGL